MAPSRSGDGARVTVTPRMLGAGTLFVKAGQWQDAAPESVRKSPGIGTNCHR